MLILCIDSSSTTATCALVNENQILAEINLNNKREHSAIVMDLIDELLQSYKLSIKDVDAFAVSEGPGSFTGLRIGMASIKGLAFGTNKPCISISTLDTLAYNAITFDGIICPIIDALRDNVYSNLYKTNNGSLISISEASCIAVDDLIAELKTKNEKIIFVGDGVAKHRGKLKEELPNAVFAPLNALYPKASSLGELAIKKLSNGETCTPNDFNPIYLKKTQAETEYEKRMGI
ncbi:MAG: tRNA (adenosine(37)-N6)-threonylcarbamoyltransferase complex dimerization subunit type 1 TsaB [Sarcina sp.]